MASLGQIKREPATSTHCIGVSPTSLRPTAAPTEIHWPGVTPPPSPKHSSALQHAASAAMHLALQMPVDTRDAVHVKREASKSGASCHSCKTSYALEELLFCRSGDEGKRILGRKRACKKKSCNKCLSAHHRTSIALQRAETTGDWWCFACRGACQCASCSKTVKREASPAVTDHVPAIADLISLQNDYNALAQDSNVRQAALQQQVVELQRDYDGLQYEVRSRDQQVSALRQEVSMLQQQVSNLQRELEAAQVASELFRNMATTHGSAKRQRVESPVPHFFNPGTAPSSPAAELEYPHLSGFSFASSVGFAPSAGASSMGFVPGAGAHFVAPQSVSLGYTAAASGSNLPYGH